MSTWKKIKSRGRKKNLSVAAWVFLGSLLRALSHIKVVQLFTKLWVLPELLKVRYFRNRISWSIKKLCLWNVRQTKAIDGSPLYQLDWIRFIVQVSLIICAILYIISNESLRLKFYLLFLIGFIVSIWKEKNT